MQNHAQVARSADHIGWRSDRQGATCQRGDEQKDKKTSDHKCLDQTQYITPHTAGSMTKDSRDSAHRRFVLKRFDKLDSGNREYAEGSLTAYEKLRQRKSFALTALQSVFPSLNYWPSRTVIRPSCPSPHLLAVSDFRPLTAKPQ